MCLQTAARSDNLLVKLRRFAPMTITMTIADNRTRCSDRVWPMAVCCEVLLQRMKMRRKCNLSWLSMLWLLAAAPLPATAGRIAAYYADIDVATWQIDDSVFECRLSQRIPQLGEAVFHHRAGEPLQFFLHTSVNPMDEGRALLTSLPPLWRGEMNGRDLGYVDVASSDVPVVLDEGRSRQLLAELQRGMVPTFMRRAWYDPEEAVHVGLSPVNFVQAQQQYTDCAAGLLPVNFEQIERSTVFWEALQTQLGAEQQRQLDMIIQYLHADSAVHAVDINSFTDSSGNPNQNLELSRQRALAVEGYLVSHGIAAERLTTRFFGSTAEYRIIRDERSDADRDRNRRVTLRLHRR